MVESDNIKEVVNKAAMLAAAVKDKYSKIMKRVVLILQVQL